ncbi:hypothetical protein ACLMJK_003149 [Lecanora helva]
MDDQKFFAIALEEAKKSLAVGGVPVRIIHFQYDLPVLMTGKVGACLVSKDGQCLGQGHNKRVQEGSATKHAEMSAIEASVPSRGPPPPASTYKGGTMYTTLLPCIMCTGACLLYGISRVVYGTAANQSVKIDTLKLLQEQGVDTVGLDVKECQDMMERWIKENPEKYRMEPWAE